MTTLLLPLALLAAAALVVSVAAHLLTLLGLPNPFESWHAILFGVTFLVWLPTVLVIKQTTREGGWAALVRACPAWLGVTTAVLFFYGQAAVWVEILGEEMSHDGFFGGYIAFNAAALATLYSLRSAERSVRRCLSGHVLPEEVTLCEICGLPVEGKP